MKTRILILTTLCIQITLSSHATAASKTKEHAIIQQARKLSKSATSKGSQPLAKEDIYTQYLNFLQADTNGAWKLCLEKRTTDRYEDLDILLIETIAASIQEIFRSNNRIMPDTIVLIDFLLLGPSVRYFVPLQSDSFLFRSEYVLLLSKIKERLSNVLLTEGEDPEFVIKLLDGFDAELFRNLSPFLARKNDEFI